MSVTPGELGQPQIEVAQHAANGNVGETEFGADEPLPVTELARQRTRPGIHAFPRRSDRPTLRPFRDAYGTAA